MNSFKRVFFNEIFLFIIFSNNLIIIKLLIGLKIFKFIVLGIIILELINLCRKKINSSTNK